MKFQIITQVHDKSEFVSPNLAALGVGHVEEPVGGGDLQVVVVSALQNYILEKIKPCASY